MTRSSNASVSGADPIVTIRTDERSRDSIKSRSLAISANMVGMPVSTVHRNRATASRYSRASNLGAETMVIWFESAIIEKKRPFLW